MNYTLQHGDNREVLRTMPSDSVDSIVCDPPYELGFMGKKWDSSGIAYDATLWAECLRVLKPGGHLIAFGGTRTYHRMTCAIEDAGFEIRDCIQWIYGSGFPKSLDVSKAMDKQNGDSQLERRLRFTAWVRSTGLTSSQIDKATGTNMGGHYTTQASQPAIMTRQHLDAVRHLIGDVPDWVEAEVDIRTTESEAWKAREVVGVGTAGLGKNQPAHEGGYKAEYTITSPHLPTAQQWHGFGTALKPANEPAVLARKPLSGTVADNVLTWGCGALNIDGCRVEATAEDVAMQRKRTGGAMGADIENDIYAGGWKRQPAGNSSGRWPANVIFDEEAAQMLDEQSGHGASRFFYVTHKEHFCTLCYNTYVKDITKEQLCESICASNVANYGWTTQETSEFTAHVFALMTQGEQLAQTVKSVTNLCDLCAMSIVVALVETKTSGFNRQACEHILDCMPKSVSYTLIQNLAYYAEKMDSIDTIQIIQSLWKLFGSVHHATENCIKQEKAARAEEDNALGMATRFLYNAKASRAEREAGLNAPPGERGNIHATVKPITLMRYLVRLVTPPGGTVLDPFMGSGSTGCAAMLEGVDFVGIELSAEYLEIAERRIAHHRNANPMGL